VWACNLYDNWLYEQVPVQPRNVLSWLLVLKDAPLTAAETGGTVSPAADSRLALQPPTSASPFRRVLVAWDGSADSVTALRTAAAIVGDGHGHVIALSVLATAAHREAEKEQAAELSAQERRLETTFEATRASIARASSVRINLQKAESRHVAGSVCDYAAEHGFDLLVIGRHGEGGLIHPKLGHIAESAARSCKIPVLLVSAS